MTYIILELFPEPFIITNMDGEIWKTDLATAKEVAENCQQGMVVPLSQSLMDDIKGVYLMTNNKEIDKRLKKYL